MELLEQLWDDGVTVVTAAGNNGPGGRDSHGSRYFEKSDYGGGK